MVISLVGTYTLTTIGMQNLALLNRIYKLNEYYNCFPKYQSGKYFELVYVIQFCKNSTTSGI